jgi:hypothetical protein
VCKCGFPWSVNTTDSSACIYNVTRAAMVVHITVFKNSLAFYNILK